MLTTGALAADRPFASPSEMRNDAGASHRTGYERTGWIVGKLALILLVPLVGGAAHTGVFVVLVGWALAGPRRAIEALTLSWLATFLNPGIYAPATGDDVLRWLVIAAAFASTVAWTAKSGWRIPRAWFWVLGFVSTASMLALQVSYAVDVSLFKLVSFLMAVTAALLGFHLTRNETDYWRRWLFSLFGVLVVAGFPLIVHPLGYVRNGRGFQGLLNHPQTYTVFIGPLLSWHVARLMVREVRGYWMWLLAMLASISLIATQGRTGVVAAGAGLLLSGLWWLVSGKFRIAIPKIWVAIGLGAMAMTGIWTVSHWEKASGAVSDFALKGKVGRSVADSFYASRGYLLERSMENFRRHPITGIGFGVASDPSTFNIRRDPLLGLPVGAATEKGFTLVAILEEVGLVGSSMFLLMLFAVLGPPLSTRTSFPATVLAASTLMVNFGEAILFAVGGSGILVWLLLGAARVTSGRRG